MILGADFGLKEVMQMVRQLAPLSSSALILGETGTGKEVIAGAIHNLSPRREKPFIKVNCGAIPNTLMDSELFGHEKGAFTGAISQKRGRFERAHGGTIFLDEIGELSAEAQVRLLRVLQEKKIERVGGTDTIDVNIRIIAATHRDLPEMVKAGKFREDLYFRLKVFPIEIPPLRDRNGDIPALVQHIIQLKAREMKLGSIPAIKNGAIEKLMTYAWPGNVRELENIVERALIIRKNDVIEFPDFEIKEIRSPKTTLPLHNQDTFELDNIEAEHIRKVLKMTNGKIEGKEGAAELLKVNPATLRNRMRKLGIEFGRK